MDNRHNIDQGSLNVYGAILAYKMNHGGLSPSIPELVDATGYQSTKPITDRLNELERKGLIVRKAGTPRSIQVVGGKWNRPDTDTQKAKLKTVTSKQAEVFKQLCRYAAKNDGNPPTMADLRRVMGYSSDSTVGHHWAALKDAGLIAPTDHSHRSVRVRGATWTVDLNEVPDLGKATASSILAQVMAEYA